MLPGAELWPTGSQKVNDPQEALFFALLLVFVWRMEFAEGPPFAFSAPDRDTESDKATEE